MRHALLLLALAAFGCAQTAPPVAHLVPADALAALMPEAVGDFQVTGDEVYRGHFADSTGAFTLVTAARTYMHGAVMMTLNVSSTDRPDRFRALIVAGGARATPDSVVLADPALAAATAAGWDAYEIAYGRLLLHEAGRAVEAKAMFGDATGEALGAVDLARLAALAEERVTVDASFTRPAPQAPQPDPTPAPSNDGTVRS